MSASKQPKNASKKFNASANDNRQPRFEYGVTRAERKRALKPPTDNAFFEMLHGEKVSDPFRPLEDIKNERTLAWIDRQNAKFEDFVRHASDMRASTMVFLDAAQPKGGAEGMASRYGDIYSCWKREEGGDRHVLHIKDSPDYDAPSRVLLDPLQIDPTGKTNIAGTYFTRDGKTLAYTLSVSGSDETTLHFMNVQTGKDLGLAYDKFRSGVSWDGDGKGFHYTRPKADSPKSFEVLYHKMGDAPAADNVVYSPDAPETRAHFYRLRRDTKDLAGTYDWISVANTERDKNALLIRKTGSTEPFREIFPHKSGTLSPIAEINGKIYALTTVDSPRQRLVRFDPAHPAPENWETVIAQDAKEPLKSVFAWQGLLFAEFGDDTGEQVKICDLDGQHLRDLPLPKLSTYTPGQILPDSDSFLLSLNNFQETGNVYSYNVKTNDLTLVKASNMPVDLKDCIVERLHAPSKDGTLVPMTVIRRPDVALDGTAATLLYGYGGFNVALDPGFSPRIAKWVRDGGVFVQSNLRGGGEYGQEWYDQGRLNNKQNVFDDFAACAEHLIKEKYTSAKRLAIQGGSNGGLLTLATGLQRPELFGAIVSEVPVADMNRFHIGSFYGFGWKGDYGDPDIKADFNNAAKYSPYHNVRKGWSHPPILIRTDANDDRVLPWHSYKMAALLQAKESKKSITLLCTANDGGHGGGGSVKKWNQNVAEVYAFLERTLGPIDQNAYKLTQPQKRMQHKNRSGKKFG